MTARSSAGTLYRRALRQARPYRPHLVGMLALSLLSSPIALLKPLPLAIAIDSVLGDAAVPGYLTAVLPPALTRSDAAVLALAAGMVVIVALLGQLQGLASQLLRTATGQRMALAFRAELFAHAQRLSLAYHDTRGTADTSYRIAYDAAAVKGLAIDGIVPFAGSAVKLVTMVAVTAQISSRLALVALVVAPLLFVVLRVSAIRLRTGWHGYKRLDSSLQSVVAEVLGGVRVVQAFGGEAREERRFAGHAAEKVRARTRLALQEGGLGLLIGLLFAAGTAAVLYLGVRQVQAGALSLGGLTLVLGYLSQLYAPLERISQRIGEVQSALASAERAFALADAVPDVAERPHARPLRRAVGALTFERVTFGYDPARPVLHDVDLHLEAGARVAVTGPTGAGKTTLISLLLRFYDPSAGRVLLDGVDLRDYRLADLRDQFALVLQDPGLFSTSIGDNIAYARPDAGFDDVVRAAKVAHAHGFVSALPDGYDTVVGERGMLLSGGERQRIALARAFLKDAPVVVLDEPTSAIDAVTEALILDAVDELLTGRTALLVTHRPSLLAGCDQHVRLEGGLVHGRVGVPRP